MTVTRRPALAAIGAPVILKRARAAGVQLEITSGPFSQRASSSESRVNSRCRLVCLVASALTFLAALAPGAEQLVVSPGNVLAAIVSDDHGLSFRVDVELPMSLAAEPFADEPGAQAFRYGPVVMAGDLGNQGLTDALVNNQQGPAVSKVPMSAPELRASGRKLEDWIKPEGSSPLTFRAATAEDSIALKPLNQLWGSPPLTGPWRNRGLEHGSRSDDTNP